MTERTQINRPSLYGRITGTLKCAMLCRRGLAAVEFALLLPVQVILFFGLIEASDAMTVNRRVALASNSLADLVAQSKVLTFDEVDALFIGAQQVMEPNSLSGMTVNLVSVVQDPRGDPIVHWSRDLDGMEPYRAGSSFTKLSDPTILTPNSSIVVAEITYDYTPTFSYRFFSSPFVFKRQTTRWPRLSTKVQLCRRPDVGCTT